MSFAVKVIVVNLVAGLGALGGIVLGDMVGWPRLGGLLGYALTVLVILNSHKLKD